MFCGFRCRSELTFLVVDLRVLFGGFTPCGRCVFPRFGGAYRLLLPGDNVVEVDPEVLGKKLMCRLYGRV